MATGELAAPAAIDWSAPWLAPLRDLQPWVDRVDWRAALSTVARERNVCNADGRPIEFVAADDAGAVAYEAHIAATGRVPSRDNRHDLFNALIWLAYPCTKAALNRRQACEIARDGIRDRRGPVRDAATVIDESGVLLAADAETAAALAQLDWKEALIERRARWGRDLVPFVFGHALLEKLLAPYKGITAAVVSLPLTAAAPAAIDRAAAAWVSQTALSPRLLAHLPVLGIPGWWPANEEPGFYADTAVFRARPKR